MASNDKKGAADALSHDHTDKQLRIERDEVALRDEFEFPSGHVQHGHWVLLHTSDGKKLFVEAYRNKTVRIGKAFVSLAAIVGCPYGSIFEIQGKHLIAVSGGLVPLDAGDGAMPDMDTSNKEYHDSNDSQELSTDKLAEMKDAGASGQEIITALTANSKSFQQKTVFSQQKYLKKKMKKYMPRLQVLQTTGSTIAEANYWKQQSKVMNMREDTMAQILTYANVHAGQQVLILESCMGTIVGSVAERLGGNGRVVCAYSGQQPSNDYIRRFNLNKPSERSVCHFPLYWLPLLAQPEAEAAAALQTANNKPSRDQLERERLMEVRRAQFTPEEHAKWLEKREDKEKRKQFRADGGSIREWLRTGVDSLIIASKYDPVAAARVLLPLLRPSCPFVIYRFDRRRLLTCAAFFCSTLPPQFGYPISWLR
jgi:tRNA (adenine-N(1)-)-methyltransferase non-catalytic subunit